MKEKPGKALRNTAIALLGAASLWHTFQFVSYWDFVALGLGIVNILPISVLLQIGSKDAKSTKSD